MSRSEALAVMRQAAELRTNLSLMRRASIPVGVQRRARSQSADFLAKKEFIYPPQMTAVGLAPGMSLEQRKQVLNVPASDVALSPEELDFQAFLDTSSRNARRATWIWRVGQQAIEMNLQGWFGFFITLTVDPSRVADSQKLWEENKEFRKYIRRLAKVSAAACGKSRAIHDGVSAQQFLKYVGVIEHGKSRHHHHMHLLIWFRGIPQSWKVDPNRGISDPRGRIHDWCRPLTTYWPHALPGIGRAKYFRHEGDVWSRLGFSLPWDAKKQRTIRIASPNKAGIYLGKYMDKDDKAWLHRVKATRGLGLTLLRRTIQEMAFQKVEALTWRPRSFDLNATIPTIHCVPSVLVRSIAKQEIFCRKWANGTLDYQTLLLPSTEVFSVMLKSVRGGAIPRRMCSKEFYDWVTAHLPVPNGYCEKRLYRALHELGVNFPANKDVPVNHTGIT